MGCGAVRSGWETVPQELFEAVLKLMDLEDVLRASLVCIHWRSSARRGVMAVAFAGWVGLMDFYRDTTLCK